MRSHTKRVLQDALALLEGGERWVKGIYHERKLEMVPHRSIKELSEASPIFPAFEIREVDSYCMLGALRMADHLYVSEAAYVLSKFVPRMEEGIHDPQFWVAAFNDAASTTYEDVALCFKQAIHALEEME